MPIRRQSQRGFTLTELLLVMAVIGFLAVLTASGIPAARERARRTACLSQLRQLHLAASLYAADYRDFLPGAGESNSLGAGRNIYLPLVSTNVRNALLQSLPDARLLDCPNLQGVFARSNDWRQPHSTRSVQLGYLYLGGRPETPWSNSVPPVTGTWASPQRLSDSPTEPLFTDHAYVAACTSRIVLAHARTGPWARHAPEHFQQAQELQASTQALKLVAGVNLVRLDGAAHWRPRSELRWRRAARENPGSDNATCMALW